MAKRVTWEAGNLTGQNIIDPSDGYAAEISVAAGTEEGNDNKFSEVVNHISVYATHAVYVAKSQAKVTTAATGTIDDRIFVAAAERRVFPWISQGFWVVNAVGGESPDVWVDGWL